MIEVDIDHWPHGPYEVYILVEGHGRTVSTVVAKYNSLIQAEKHRDLIKSAINRPWGLNTK